MSWTLCTSGSAILKAGVNVNSTIVNYGTNKTFLDQLSDEAENYASTLARSNIIGNYATLTANGKQIFSQLCAAKVAQMLINYDIDAIGGSSAALMLNVLDDDIQTAVKIITEQKNKTYLGII